MTGYQLILDTFGTPTRESVNELKFVCPECGYNALTVSVTEGVYYCFICEFGKKKPPLFETKKIISRPFKPELHRQVLDWLITNLKISDPHRSYLKKRGLISPEKFSIKTVPPRIEVSLRRDFSDQELLESGFFRQSLKSDITGWPCLKFNRLLIPIHNDGKLTAFKTRVDPRDEANSDQVKFAIPYGTRPEDLVSFYKNERSDYSIFTEGELKAMIPYESYGYETIGSAGINGLAGVLDFAIKNKDYLDSKKKVVVFDLEERDDEYRSRVQALKLALAVSNTSIMHLPRVISGYKNDLDSFIIYDHEWFEDLLDYSWKNRDEIINKEKEFLNEKTKSSLF